MFYFVSMEYLHSNNTVKQNHFHTYLIKLHKIMCFLLRKKKTEKFNYFLFVFNFLYFWFKSNSMRIIVDTLIIVVFFNYLADDLKTYTKNYQLTYFWIMDRLVIVYMSSCNLQDKLVKTFKRKYKYVFHYVLSNKENQNNQN